jgi:hypothetical protein
MKKITGYSLALFVAPYLIVYGLLFLACKDDSLKKAARASDDMAQTISAAIETKRALAQNGFIDPKEELQLTLTLKKVNDIAIQFNKQARAIGKLDSVNRKNLMVVFRQLSQSINELSQQGVLSIKNENSKAQLAAILGGLDISLKVIEAALEGGS